jgi:hypothetical protein
MIDPCGDGCPLCEADELARERRLATHRRYNLSAKGQARNRAYEAAHPERKLRWEPARNAARSPNGKRPGGGVENRAPAPGSDSGGVGENGYCAVCPD